MKSKVFQTKSKQIETVPVEMKVIEPFSPDIIEFDTKEEFFEYVSQDMEHYKSLTTQKLNRMFHISGYRITKIQQELALKKSTNTNNTSHTASHADRRSTNQSSTEQPDQAEIKEAINTLSQQINIIMEVLAKNNLIKLQE